MVKEERFYGIELDFNAALNALDTLKLCKGLIGREKRIGIFLVEIPPLSI